MINEAFVFALLGECVAEVAGAYVLPGDVITACLICTELLTHHLATNISIFIILLLIQKK